MLILAAVILVAFSYRLGGRTSRTSTQGLAVLLAAAGAILSFRQPGSAFHLPGWGPRRWSQP